MKGILALWCALAALIGCASRAVAAHGGALYVTTSNRDGRGTPGKNDDKLLRVTF